MGSNGRDRLTTDALRRVFFRTADGQTVDAATASDAHFDAWIRTRMTIAYRHDATWTPAERAALCDVLWQHDQLVLATDALLHELAHELARGK